MRGESNCLEDFVKKEEVKGEWLNGIYNELADLLGMDAAMKIHAAYRGQQVTFPVELYNRSFIRQRIVSEYDGSKNNIKQLATKYGYSEKWIRKILKENIDKLG